MNELLKPVVVQNYLLSQLIVMLTVTE